MGFREGAMRFMIANLPTLGVSFHSFCHILVMAFLALRLAFDLVVLKGILHLCVVASLVRVSALSLPGMPQWLGHHTTVMERFGCVLRRGDVVVEAEGEVLSRAGFWVEDGPYCGSAV